MNEKPVNLREIEEVCRQEAEHLRWVQEVAVKAGINAEPHPGSLRKAAVFDAVAGMCRFMLQHEAEFKLLNNKLKSE